MPPASCDWSDHLTEESGSAFSTAYRGASDEEIHSRHALRTPRMSVSPLSVSLRAASPRMSPWRSTAVAHRVDVGPHRSVLLARDDELGQPFVAAPLGVRHAVDRRVGGKGRAPHDEEGSLVGCRVFEHLEVGVHGEEHLVERRQVVRFVPPGFAGPPASPVRSWLCARSASWATSASFEPKWWVGRPRLTPARPPMLANDAPWTPRSATTSAAASSRASSDRLRRSAWLWSCRRLASFMRTYLLVNQQASTVERQPGSADAATPASRATRTSDRR